MPAYLPGPGPWLNPSPSQGFIPIVPAVDAEVVAVPAAGLGAFPVPAVTAAGAYSAEVLADTPTGYWRLNDLTDSSGNGFTLTQNGTVGSVSGLLTSDLGNGAKRFLTDFTTDGLVRADNSLLDQTTTFTVEAWVQVAFIGAQYRAVQKDQSYWLGTNGSGHFSAVLIVGGSAFTVTDPYVAVADTTYHIAAVRSSGSLFLYVNGTLVDTNATLTGGLPTDTANLAIGADVGVQTGFWGTVDEAAVYQSALSGARIAAHYAAGIASGGATVAAVPADGVGAFPAPTIQAGSVVTAVPAAGLGAFPAPTIQAGSAVAAVPADGLGMFPVPAVSGGLAAVPGLDMYIGESVMA